MHIFAKLFQVKDHQVLYLKNYDEDEDENEIIQVIGKTAHHEAEIELKYSFTDESAMEDYFRNLNQETAEKFFDQIKQSGINLLDDDVYAELVIRKS